MKSVIKVPPNWTNVTVSPNPKSKVQATGYDSKGRKQYIYHEEWVNQSHSTKFKRVSEFNYKRFQRVLKIYIKKRDLSKECVIANVLKLMNDHHIRVGNQVYLDQNGSIGVTTMMKCNVQTNGSKITLKFKGKSGVVHTKNVTDKNSIEFIKRVSKVSGKYLFYYLSPDTRRVTSHNINSFLHNYVQHGISSKDIRTHNANRIFSEEMSKKHTGDDKQVTRAIKQTALKLGNTPAVCRGSYIAPQTMSKYKQSAGT